MATSKRYSAGVPERAVQMAAEHLQEYSSQWPAIVSIARFWQTSRAKSPRLYSSACEALSVVARSILYNSSAQLLVASKTLLMKPP